MRDVLSYFVSQVVSQYFRLFLQPAAFQLELQSPFPVLMSLKQMMPCFHAPSQMWVGICLQWELCCLRPYKVGQGRNYVQLQFLITHYLWVLMGSITYSNCTNFWSSRNYSQALEYWDSYFWWSLVAQSLGGSGQVHGQYSENMVRGSENPVELSCVSNYKTLIPKKTLLYLERKSLLRK